MLNLDSTVEAFMAWLTLHQQIAYLILFLGAYFETLIGPSFFIPGELFLLSGSLLGGAEVLNIFYVALMFYMGAILGDNSSYFIGRKVGVSIFKEGRKVFSIKNYRQGEAFFKRFGDKAIFLARITGPLSWITPFLAGIYQVSYKKFLKYNIPGIFVGIGEFLVIGYFFGNRYKLILHYFEYAVLFITAFIILYITWRWYKQKNYPNKFD